MQVQLNLTFDLETAGGRKLFAQLQNALMPVPDRVVLVNPPAAPANTEQLDRAEAAKAGRQQAAANARAAKAAKQAGPPAGTNGGAEDLGDQLVGDDADTDTDDLGLADPSMSPAEAKEAALALVRQMYAAGKVAEVKKLQKEYQVAKFYDVPLEKGHQFYREVLAISHKVMGAQA